MKKKLLAGLAIGLLSLSITGTSFATIIDFTGGTVYKTAAAGGGTVVTTAGSELIHPTDYYIENGFKLDFINTAGGGEYIGDYYGADATGTANDVIHGHWAPGHGDMTAIEISKEGGGTFDLNYFILTSNSAVGGGSATGSELTYIEAWVGGSMTYSQLLDPDSWGWDGVYNPGPLQNDPQVYLGSEFDAVDLVRFTVGSNVYCFGMDEFYIDEAAPPSVPEPATMLLFGTGIAGLAGTRLRRKKK